MVSVDTTQQPGHRAFTTNAKKVLESSLREAIRLDAHEINAECLLLGATANR